MYKIDYYWGYPIFWWWAGLCFLPVVDLRPNYGGGNEDNGNLLQKVHAHNGALIAPDPVVDHCQPTPLLEYPGHSQASLGQSLVGSLLRSPGSWSAQRFVCALQEPVCPVPCKFWWLSGGVTPPRGLLPHPGLLYPEPLPLQQATTD